MKKFEKGSITLFVLIAIIFFIIIASGVYISIRNKNISQDNDTQKIEEQYNKDVQNIDNIYEEELKRENNIIGHNK